MCFQSSSIRAASWRAAANNLIETASRRGRRMHKTGRTDLQMIAGQEGVARDFLEVLRVPEPVHEDEFGLVFVDPSANLSDSLRAEYSRDRNLLPF